MQLEFTKMHGAGNDFVMVEDMNDRIDLDAEQVAALCERHFGIGADGVIVVKPSPRPECAAYMHYINADGSLAQMCGNGVRCFAKYLVDHKLLPQGATSFVADTLAGPRPITFEVDENGLMTRATVDMGEPILDPAKVPTTLAATKTVEGLGQAALEAPLLVEGQTWPMNCVSMGNPHAVTFVDDPEALDLAHLGPLFETNAAFPEKANTEFATVRADGSIRMRVWERGCGETWACGTGACATAVAACLTGRAGRQSTLVLNGGVLSIRWDEQTNHVFMTGPAATSFTGTVTV